MADRGIIFSAPMVRALLEGRKTQTRRLVNVRRYAEPLDGYSSTGRLRNYYGDDRLGLEFVSDKYGLWGAESNPNGRSAWIIPVPYALGDQLYVREACRAEEMGDEGRDGVVFLADDQFVPITNNPSASIRWLKLYHYGQKAGESPAGLRGRSVPSIHMPRWASRLTLTVTDVRVERLQEISEADILAEGAPLDPNHRDCTQDGSNPHMCVIDGDPWGRTQSPRAWYHRLWDTLHTKPGERWEDDPSVVAVSFDVRRGNIDA